MVATLVPPARQRQRRQRRGQVLPPPGGAGAAQRLEQQAPWLAAVHRATTLALVGLGLSLFGLSALTSHWQNDWARSYKELVAARELEQRLQESAAVLEQHHIELARRSGVVVPTSSENLIHLRQPEALRRPSARPLLAELQLQRIAAGF
ncbi:MAG: hypothetical protein VKJ44_02320 [Synechococcus sp.]|nr:hypothetical protein [Synechococcus sp.]